MWEVHAGCKNIDFDIFFGVEVGIKTQFLFVREEHNGRDGSDTRSRQLNLLFTGLSLFIVVVGYFRSVGSSSYHQQYIFTRASRFLRARTSAVPSVVFEILSL